MDRNETFLQCVLDRNIAASCFILKHGIETSIKEKAMIIAVNNKDNDMVLLLKEFN